MLENLEHKGVEGWRRWVQSAPSWEGEWWGYQTVPKAPPPAVPHIWGAPSGQLAHGLHWAAGAVETKW